MHLLMSKTDLNKFAQFKNEKELLDFIKQNPEHAGGDEGRVLVVDSVHGITLQPTLNGVQEKRGGKRPKAKKQEKEGTRAKARDGARPAYKTYDDLTAEVLKYLSATKPSSTGWVADTLEADPAKVSRVLGKLAGEGRAIPSGKGRGTKYVLAAPNGASAETQDEASA